MSFNEAEEKARYREAVKLTRHLVDHGQLIEAGWQSLRLMALPEDTPDYQLKSMREAFFAGAHHLFASIMAILEPGHEATEQDLNRLTIIQSELAEYLVQFKREHNL